ncbi:MAG TPA: helix-turn-helix transcriptional regulator [Dermatophilaceae bacterium]|nr:helix-turn-helix transcriptional regulator [Dermatophilaceae bacterium]
MAPPSPVPAFVPDDDTPLFVISVAAELAGMHAQTLRQYDRLGLVTPSRTRGGGRRYSPRDVAVLRDIQRLSQEEGVSLAGVARILQLEAEVSALREQVGRLADELEGLHAVTRGAGRVFAVSPTGDVLPGRLGERPRSLRSQAIVVWRPQDRAPRQA